MQQILRKLRSVTAESELSEIGVLISSAFFNELVTEKESMKRKKGRKKEVKIEEDRKIIQWQRDRQTEGV